MENIKDITKVTTYPEELAKMFAGLAGDRHNFELIQELTKAFEWIEAAAQNPYNADYWRALYKTFDTMAYKY